MISAYNYCPVYYVDDHQLYVTASPCHSRLIAGLNILAIVLFVLLVCVI